MLITLLMELEKQKGQLYVNPQNKQLNPLSRNLFHFVLSLHLTCSISNGLFFPFLL